MALAILDQLIRHNFETDTEAVVPEFYTYSCDHVSCFGMPACVNVWTNVPFLVVGVLGIGLRKISWAHRIIFVWLIAQAFVSVYHHLVLDPLSLALDRTPIALLCGSITAVIVREHVNRDIGNALLVAAPSLCAWTVWYWYLSHNLLPYMMMQFGVLFIAPLPLVYNYATNKLPYTHSFHFLALALWYMAAKFIESADENIAAATSCALSGHQIKHVFAAFGFFHYYLHLLLRRPTHKLL